MKKLKSTIKSWWEYIEERLFCDGEEYLTKADKRYLLYWSFMMCLCTMAVTAFLLNSAYDKNQQQYEEGLYDFLNTVAAYVGSATDDELEQITEELREELVFTRFNTDNDIEMYMKYIVNTSEQCPLDQEDYGHRFYLVMTNHGGMQPLDIFQDDSSPDTEYSYIQMENMWDEVSETGVNILFYPNDYHTDISIRTGSGIVSAHRMKRIYCDECIRTLFDMFEDTYREEIFIFDSATHEVYPISESVLNIDSYTISISLNEDSGYSIVMEQSKEE